MRPDGRIVKDVSLRKKSEAFIIPRHRCSSLAPEDVYAFLSQNLFRILHHLPSCPHSPVFWKCGHGPQPVVESPFQRFMMPGAEGSDADELLVMEDTHVKGALGIIRVVEACFHGLIGAKNLLPDRESLSRIDASDFKHWNLHVILVTFGWIELESKESGEDEKLII